MNTQNKNLKKVIKGITIGFAALAMIFAIGCDKKKSRGGGAATPGLGFGPGFGGGGGFNNGGGIISAGVENSGRMLVYLATYPQVNNSFGTGPAYVEGELVVTTPTSCILSGTGLNPGRYQLLPYQNQTAILDGSLISNVVLVANGPGGQAIVSIPYAYIFNTNICGQNGMMGSLSIESVNGFACGIHTGFTDQIQPPQC